MLRGCKNDQERQELQNVVLVENLGLSASLEDSDLPDWMKQGDAVPAWFGGGENPGGVKA